MATFNVYRRTAGDNEGSVMIASGLSTKSIELQGLEKNKKYFFRVGTVKNGIEKLSPEIEVYTGSDEYISNVVTILHFESGLIDSMGTRTWLSKGAASINTTRSKFGSSCLYIPNNTSDIYTNSSPIARYNHFTMEAWIYKVNGVNDPAGLNFIFSQTNGGAQKQQGVSITMAGTLRFQRQSAIGSTIIIDTSVPIIYNEWNHVAFAFDGTKLMLFLNGELVGSGTNYDGWYPTGIFTIGSYRNASYTTYGFYGYIDEVRITKDICRYTKNFTPPSEPFPSE